MSNVQQVIDKVRKLRALAAQTSNVHEAEAAATQADRLFQAHGLEEAQLEAAGDATAETPDEETEPLVQWIGRAPTWQWLLSCGLTRHYDCVSYWRWTVRGGQSRIVGRPSDVATVRYMYGWLSVEIERLAQTHKGQGRSWLDSFRRGAVQGILSKLKDSKHAALAEARAKSAIAQAITGGAAGSAALAIYDARAEAARARLHELHPDLAEQAKRSRGGTSIRGASNDDGYQSGREAGGKIHTGAAIAAAPRPRLSAPRTSRAGDA